MRLSTFIKSVPELEHASEIVFYGGSFNPWHDGHSACVILSPKEFPLIIIPDHNPQKQIILNKNLDFSKLTVQLKKLREKIWIYEGFYFDRKFNPTIEWVRDLRNVYPKKNFSLLLGHDSFINLKSWKNANELLNLLSSLYVVSRQDDDEKNIFAQKQYLMINPKLTISQQGHHEFEHLSSTQLR